MAYITKEEVKAKNEALKAINKKYGIKARFSGSNSSTLTLKITEGAIDFVANWIDCYTNNPRFEASNCVHILERQHINVNHYYIDRNFAGVALEYLQEAYKIMLDGHWDESDIMTDYFSCSYYCSIQIGAWNKPYKLV